MNYRKIKGWKYELLDDMECTVEIPVVAANDYIHLNVGCRCSCLEVSAHYAWDGPSGPTFDTPTNMRASCFHDALCQLIGEGLLDKQYRKYGDQLLRTHMLEDQLKDADGTLVIYGAGGKVLYQSKKKYGLDRAIYLVWGRFRANGYYKAVRAYSKFKGM